MNHLSFFYRLSIVEEQNATIEYVLLNNPKCPECISEMSNETLCFTMYTNGTNDDPQIDCLMDRGLFGNLFNSFTVILCNKLMKLYRLFSHIELLRLFLF